MVSRQTVIADARVRSQVSSCEICGEQSGTRARFSPECFAFSLSVSFHQCSILMMFVDPCIIVQFIKKNPTRCNSVSKFYYSMLI